MNTPRIRSWLAGLLASVPAQLLGAPVSAGTVELAHDDIETETVIWQYIGTGDLIHGPRRPATEGGSVLLANIDAAEAHLRRACVVGATPTDQANAAAAWSLVCPVLDEPVSMGEEISTTCSYMEVAAAVRVLVETTQLDCDVSQRGATLLYDFANNWVGSRWATDPAWHRDHPVWIDPRAYLGLAVERLEDESAWPSGPPELEVRQAAVTSVAEAALGLSAAGVVLHTLDAVDPEAFASLIESESEGDEASLEGAWSRFTTMRQDSCAAVREVTDAWTPGVSRVSGETSSAITLASNAGRTSPICHTTEKVEDKAMGRLGQPAFLGLPPPTRAQLVKGAENIVLERRLAREEEGGDEPLHTNLVEVVARQASAFVGWSEASTHDPRAEPLYSGRLGFFAVELAHVDLKARPSEYKLLKRSFLPSLFAGTAAVELLDAQSSGELGGWTQWDPYLPVEMWDPQTICLPGGLAEEDRLELIARHPMVYEKLEGRCQEGSTSPSLLIFESYPELTAAFERALPTPTTRRSVGNAASPRKGADAYVSSLLARPGNGREDVVMLALEADRVAGEKRQLAAASELPDVELAAREVELAQASLLRDAGLGDLADVLESRRDCATSSEVPSLSHPVLRPWQRRSVLVPQGSDGGPLLADGARTGGLHLVVADDVLQRTGGFELDLCSPWKRTTQEGVSGTLIRLPLGAVYTLEEDPDTRVRVVASHTEALVMGDPTRDGTDETPTGFIKLRR